jgi:hypothetical protein
VHIDASNSTLGVMLGQNLVNTIDRRIHYATVLMNNVEKIYTTTKKGALVMIYVVKKFKHYLLGNNYIFFVNHQTILYMMNKLIITS